MTGCCKGDEKENLALFFPNYWYFSAISMRHYEKQGLWELSRDSLQLSAERECYFERS